MASLLAIRTALANTISANTTTEIFTYNTVPDLTNLPAAIIEPVNADFEMTMQRGLDCWEFHIYVVCSRADTQTGQETLDGFVGGSGPNSIRQILYNNPTLGLTDGTDAMVYALIGYGGTFEAASIALVGAILKVRVYTDGRV